jgi:aminoglycoside phosphotransferase (APT) family kinase protein
MIEYWRKRDCQLEPADVKAIVREQLGAVDPETVQYLDEGWDSWAYAAAGRDGATWILRFPKRAGVAGRMAHETVLLPLVAPWLPLAVPAFRFVGEPGARYPHRFVAYHRIAGRTALGRPPAGLDVRALGESLGGFLAALHGFPVDRVERLGLDRDGGGPADFAEEVIEEWEELGARVAPAEIRARVRAHLRRPPPSSAAPPCLVHADFFPEHFIVERGQVAGVIDWSDAKLGDPARDLAGLSYWLGEPLLTAGLDGYRAAHPETSRADLAALATRARFYALCRAVEDVAYGTQAGRDDYRDQGLRAIGRLAGAG